MTNDSLTPEAGMETAQPTYVRILKAAFSRDSLVGRKGIVLRTYIEPASDWSGRPEMEIAVVAVKGIDYPVHLQPDEIEKTDAPIEPIVPAAPSPVASEGGGGLPNPQDVTGVRAWIECDGWRGPSETLQDHAHRLIHLRIKDRTDLLAELTAHNETKCRLEEAEKKCDTRDIWLAEKEVTLCKVEADRDHWKGLAEKGGAK
jgi:hypothetical protein